MTTFTHFVRGLSSYNANVLMAALISLLLVILFILLLHIYARWFLAQSRTRRRRRTTVRTDRFIHFRSFPFESSDLGSKGLDSAAISSIPLFVYSSKLEGTNLSKQGSLECAICLSQFEENEAGRNLSKCGHCFHVDCVDIWLQSNSSCPICRAPAVSSFSPAAETNEYHSSINPADSAAAAAAAAGENNGEVGHVPSEGDATVLLEVEIHSSSDVDNNSTHNIVELIRKDDDHSATMSAASSSSSSCIGCSLKRMLSRNRSEGKIFPSYEDGQLQI